MTSQPPGGQGPGGRVEHGLESLQAGRAAEQRNVGLVKDGTRQRRLVTVFDIWRVGRDEIEGTVDPVEKRRLDPRHPVLHTVSTGVVTCNGERRRGDVGRRDAGPRNLAEETDRQAAAPGADVGEPGRRRSSFFRRASDSSTMNSVSGRGMSTSDVTRKSRPQNSRLPTM